MTTPTVTEIRRNGNPVGERIELARYAVPVGERVLYGQRVNGVVRVTDVPAGGRGRAYLVERELELLVVLPKLLIEVVPLGGAGPRGPLLRSRVFEIYPDRQSAVAALIESGPAHGWLVFCGVRPDLAEVFRVC